LIQRKEIGDFRRPAAQKLGRCFRAIESRAMSGAPDFSPLAERYAVGRPTYPLRLYEWLAGLVERREAAWDCATGSGQAARDLVAHFGRVFATDASADQLRFAPAHPRIELRVAPAEASGLETASVDLVTVAAAAHWFDLPAFGAEARRVARPGGVLAVWTYHAGIAEPPAGELLGPFYWELLQPYFAPGARLADERYETLELPGEPIPAPRFTMTARWRRDRFVAYLESWSGVAAYRRARGEDPVALVRDEIDRLWEGPEREIEMRWPLFVRAQRL
jgi:SAM-dependent methyltransferase